MRMLWLLLLLSACTNVRVEEESPSPLPAVELRLSASEQLTLNVSIAEFDVSALSVRDDDAALVEVRNLERRYLPYVLKQALDESGYWGAVRVLPVADPGAEIILTGRVEESNGTAMVLSIEVRDATGRLWTDKRYADRTGELDYAADPHYRRDPFQDLYHAIANDMSHLLVSLSAEEAERIRETAALKFAGTLAPEVFGRYLRYSADGLLEIVALPAESDSLYAHVLRIRESEHLFADSVDAHYESLYRQLGPTYAWWRHYHYELTRGNERLGEIDPTRGATEGSWYAMERIYRTYRESKMNEDALRELNQSFDREARPLVTNIAGRVIKLDGSLADQYRAWRVLLEEIYRSETGL